MIHREKHLLKGPSVKVYCFLKAYVNYCDFGARRTGVSSEVACLVHEANLHLPTRRGYGHLAVAIGSAAREGSAI